MTGSPQDKKSSLVSAVAVVTMVVVSLSLSATTDLGFFVRLPLAIVVGVVVGLVLQAVVSRRGTSA